MKESIMNNQNYLSIDNSLYNKLLNKKIGGSLTNGQRFGGLLVSFNDKNVVVEGGRSNRVLLRRDAIVQVYEVIA